jgi:opacity protein-like surface antigen
MRLFALVLSSMLFTSNVLAAQGSSKGTYMGIGFGFAQYTDTDHYSALEQYGMTYNLYGGYSFNHIISLELGYNNYGDMRSNGNKLMSPESLSFSTNFGYTFDNSIRPFALIGASYVNINPESNSGLTEGKDFGVHFGVGIEYSPFVNMTIRLISQADGVNIDSQYQEGLLTWNESTFSFGSWSLGASYKF